MPLPPIPVESWIADQQDLFNKTIGGLFPSLEFQDATNDAAAQIPYDYPYAGGEDSFREEQERIRQLQEEEDRRVEQERLQAEAQQQQAMAAAQQATLQQQEMARQQELQGQAHQQASLLGIPLPQQISSLFQGVSGPPGSGDHASTSGAFDPSPMAPAPVPGLDVPDPTQPDQSSPYDFRGMESGVGETLPTTPNVGIPEEPPKMGGLGDFKQYASGLWDQVNEYGRSMQEAAPTYSPGVLPGPTETERKEYEEQTSRIRTGRNADNTRVGQDYGFSDTGQDTLTRGAGLLGAVETVSDAVRSRIDPVIFPELATDGIIESEFSEEDKRKVRTVQEKMMQVGADKAVISEQEAAEARAIQDRARERYEQIKNDPDAMTKYANASPNKSKLDMALALLTLPIGGVAKGAASASATRLGASPQAARAAGYVADITAQSAVDPTNLPLQGGLDVLSHGAGPALRGVRDAASTVFTPRGPLDQAVTYGRDLGGRVLEDLGEGMRRTFNLPERELSDEAREAIQKGIVPLEVRRRTTPNVELPTDRQTRADLEEAVRWVGGRVDDEGVHFGSTRAYHPRAVGQPAMRGGVFEEPVRRGQQSGYINAEEEGSVGGTHALPRTETTYRNPLVVYTSEDFGGDHLSDAYQKLKVGGEPTPELRRILERSKAAELRELYATYTPEQLARSKQQRGGYGFLEEIEGKYNNVLQRYGAIDRTIVDSLVEIVEARFKTASPNYRRAMQEIIRSYGGDPSAFDDVASIEAIHRAGSDMGWIVNESIVSAAGRKQGKDGLLVLKPLHPGVSESPMTITEAMDFQVSHLPGPPDIPSNPTWVKANAEYEELMRRYAAEENKLHQGGEPDYDLLQQMEQQRIALGSELRKMPQHAEPVEVEQARDAVRAAEDRIEDFKVEWGLRHGKIPEQMRNYYGFDQAVQGNPEEVARYEAVTEEAIAARRELQAVLKQAEESGTRPPLRFRLHPELDPTGELSTMKGAIRARNMPRTEEKRPGFQRMYHGSNTPYETPDPTKYNPRGLYGPGHYLTSDPRVAGGIIQPANEWSAIRDVPEMGGMDIVSAGYASRGVNWWENLVGGHIRPADVDNRATLFHSEKPVPASEFRKIARAVQRYADTVDHPDAAEAAMEYSMLANASDEVIRQHIGDGKSVYARLSSDFIDPRELDIPTNWDDAGNFLGGKDVANKILADAGFDGVYYRGGENIGFLDENARPVEHDAVVIFPERLDAIRNALTGELRGARGGPAQVGEAESYALRALPTRSVVGGAGGAAAGYAAGDENTTPEQRLKNTVVGGVLGSVGAQKGTLASARLVDSLIQKGVLSSEILARHPVTPARIQALYALAARNLQDDEEVAIPGMVGLLTKLEPEQRLAVEELINGPKTAGEIRAILGQMADPTDLGREAQTLITDLLAGTGIRGARASETRADRATLEGITDLNPFSNLDTEVERGAARISTEHGPAVRLPEDEATTRFVHQVADELGVPRPTVYLSGHPEPGAFASTGKGENSVILTKGLAGLDLNADEMRALITHELAHTTEQSFGASLIGRAFRALDRSFGQTAEELAGAVRTPRRGVWKERVENGPEIPPTATARQTNDIQRQYDEAMRLIEKSQQPRLKAKNQIRYISQAHDVWEKYEAAVTAARKGGRAAPTPSAPSPVRGRPPREPEVAPDELLDEAEAEAYPFGRGEAAPVREPIPLTPEEAAADIQFDANPLPDVFDPSERIDHADIGRLISQLNEELALDPKLQSQMQAASVRLMGMPKPRAKHIQDFVEKIGERRAVPRGMTQTEAGQAWADRFFRKNGWLAPDTVEPAVSGETAEAVLRNTAENVEDLAARGEAAPVSVSREFNDQGQRISRTDFLENLTPGARVKTDEFLGSDVGWSASTLDRVIRDAADAGYIVRRAPYQDGAMGLVYVGKADGSAVESATDRVARQFLRWAEELENPTPADITRAKGMLDEGVTFEADPSTARSWNADYSRARMQERELGRVSPPEGTRLADEILDAAEDADLEPTDAVMRELADTDLDDIEELTDRAVEDMPGIIGKRRVNPRLQQNVTLNKDPGVNALLNPNAGKSHRGRTDFEKIHDFWREKVVPKVSDEMAILQGFQNDLAREYLEQHGQKIPHDVLAAELKRLDAGRRAEMEINRRLKPALQTFRRLELPMEHVNNYLAYQHQLDVATQQKKATIVGGQVVVQQGNFNRNVPGGADLADAQQWVDDFEQIYRAELGPQRYAEFEKAVDQVWDFGQSLLDEKLSAGLITQADYNAMRQAYPRYVPTRILNYLDDENRVGLGKSLSVNDNLIREMTYQGTKKEALSPLAAMIGDAYSTYATGQKNRVFNALVDLQSIGRSLNLPNTARGQRIQTVLDAMQPMFNPNQAAPKNAVSMSGFINGTKQKYMVDKAIGDMTNFESPTTIPFLGAAMSAFRAGATARNPVFLTANMMLDFSNYMIREAAREGGPTPQNVTRVMGEYLKVAAQHLPIGAMTGTGVGGYMGGQTVNEDDTMLSAAAKIGAGAVGGGVVGAGADKLFGNKALSEMLKNEYSGGMEEFLQQGGGTAGAYFERAGLPVEPTRMKIGPRGGQQADVDSIINALGYRKQSAIEGQVGKLQEGAIEIKSPQDLWRAMKELTAKDVLTKAKDAVLLKPVEKLGERIELVPRVAAMNLAKKRGESMVEAVNKGRTTTTDFNKGGTLSRFINQFVPFFNVGVQGTADIGRAFSENPKAFTAMLGTSIVGPVAAAEVWNTSDPQMRKDYEDVPDYIKDQGLVVMLPESLVGKYPVDAQGNRHPQFFHFRYRNFAPFAILTREFMKRTLTDRDMPEDDRRGMLDQFLGATEQLSPIGIGSAQEFGTSVLPPVMGTIAQLGFDQDTFRGRRIKSKQADERASPLSKALADRTGMGTAAQWEFATRDIGTGYAGMVHGLSDIVAGTERTRKTSPQERPLTGGLYGRVVKGSIGGVAERETDQGGNWLSQSQLVTPSAERLLRQNSIKWRPAANDPEVAEVPLTRSEYGAYQKQANQLVDEVIHEVLSDPDYQGLTAAEKESIMQRIITRRKRGITADFLEKVPDAELDRRRQEAKKAK